MLIVSATDAEVAALKKAKLSDVDVLVAGLGMVATAYAMGKTLVEKKYDAAINLGVAGSFNHNINIGDVVNVYQDCFAELGAENGADFIPINQMGLSANNTVDNVGNALSNTFIELIPKITGITVNTVHGNDASIAAVYKRFRPYVETMEGAAFLYACKQANLQCLQLRSISNYVELRDKSKWNMPLAIENLNRKAIEVIESLNS
jgi:futalosine hydrolase